MGPLLPFAFLIHFRDLPPRKREGRRSFREISSPTSACAYGGESDTRGFRRQAAAALGYTSTAPPRPARRLVLPNARDKARIAARLSVPPAIAAPRPHPRARERLPSRRRELEARRY